jgi:hypothetical protein
MLKTTRKRDERIARRRSEDVRKGIRLELTLEEIMADLNFGVGPIADSISLRKRVRREAPAAS